MRIAENIDLSNYLDTNSCEYFLTMEKVALDIIAEDMHADGIIPDYSLLSIPHVLKWILGRIELLNKSNLSLENAEYISHINGQIDDMVLHAAYYLGESYVKTVPSLSWDIDKNSFKKGAVFPSVTGFKYDFRMYPLDEINEIRKKISERRNKTLERAIDEVILQWLMKV